MGCILYIAFSLVIMGSSQWKTPQSFYLKYEGPHMKQELKELQEEIEYFDKLKEDMIAKGLYKEDAQEAEVKTETPEPEKPAE